MGTSAKKKVVVGIPGIVGGLLLAAAAVAWAGSVRPDYSGGPPHAGDTCFCVECEITICSGWWGPVSCSAPNCGTYMVAKCPEDYPDLCQEGGEWRCGTAANPGGQCQ
jgi:hypothetical protein